MSTMPRRRARLRSSQYASERWKPPLAAIVLVVGVVAGFVVGIRGRLGDQSASIEEHYMLLVSDLYAQGEPLAATQNRLVTLGFSNPSVAVVGVADQLSGSSDKVNQQEGDQLRQFAAALAGGPEQQSPPPTTAVASPSPTSGPAPSPTTDATALAVAAVVSPTSVSAPAAPQATPNAAPAAPASSAPAPAAAAPPAASGSGKTGVVSSTDHLPVYLRKEPSAKSAAVSTMPFGATVTITGVVQGEAVNAGESHWYHVTYRGHVGYAYSAFIVIGG